MRLGTERKRALPPSKLHALEARLVELVTLPAG